MFAQERPGTLTGRVRLQERETWYVDREGTFARKRDVVCLRERETWYVRERDRVRS